MLSGARETFQVSIDKDLILYVREQRVMTPQSVRAEAEEIARQFEKYILSLGKKPKRQVLDLTGVQLGSIMQCREVLNETARMLRKYADPKEPVRVAVLGLNRLLSIAASFVFNAAGYINAARNVQFFSSEEEAIAWLKKE